MHSGLSFLKYLLPVMLLPVFRIDAFAGIDWIDTVYNFGAIKEGDGSVEGSARFVNRGREATFISRVRPSCGCTGASYSQDLIQPGDTATISFTYNPLGRPGKFDKTIKVYTGTDNELSVIRIVGTVIATSATLSTSFPIEVGPLRLETATLTAGEIKRGAPRHIFVNAYNDGTDTIRPRCISTSKPVTVDLTPKTLAPGEIATFSFYIDSSKEELPGAVEYPVTFIADDSNPDSEKLSTTIYASIVPDTRLMTAEEIDNGPRAFLVPEFVDFNDVKTRQSLQFTIEIENEGRTDMKVERVYSRNPAVSVSSFQSKIKPGKKGKIKGKLNPDKIETGPFRIPLEVITNDAIHPIRTANLVGIKKE